MWKVILFFKYVFIEFLEEFCERIHSKCLICDLKGRVLLAKEGINGTLAGTDECIDSFIAFMESDERFAKVDWKESTSSDETPPFPCLSVRIVNEIISCGTKGNCEMQEKLHFESEIFGGLAESGQHLSPEEFHAAAADPNSIILDIRNQYEYDIGHFQQAQSIGTYTYAETFDRLEEMFDNQQLKNEGEKKVLMYCTGGIRCEKASAYLRLKGVSNVYQLQGGIHRYLQAYPDGGLFAGKNFVFDSRVTMAPSDTAEIPSEVVTSSIVKVGRCIDCQCEYDQYSGSVVCTVCRMPVLACPDCIASNTHPHEYYCIRHRDLRGLYLTALEGYPVEELRRQYDGLERLLQLSLQVAEDRKDKRLRQRKLNNQHEHYNQPLAAENKLRDSSMIEEQKLLNLGSKRRKTIRKQLLRLEFMIKRLENITEDTLSSVGEEVNFSQPKSRLGLGFWTS